MLPAVLAEPFSIDGVAIVLSRGAGGGRGDARRVACSCPLRVSSSGGFS